MKPVLAVTLLLAVLTNASSAGETSDGQSEYLTSCAACHGSSGKGDGPLTEELEKRPTDLTQLADQNGGEFPFWRVYATIDGRYVVRERDMPDWGRAFLEDDAKTFGPNGGEIATRRRIHELAAYIQSLQK